LHGIWASALVPTITQHVMGLVAGVLVFDIARRLGASEWWSALPAAVVLLSVDQVGIENLLMSDALSGFFLVAAMWTTVRSVASSRPVLWLAAGSALTGAAITVRPTSVVVVPFLLIVACWQHGWRARLQTTAAVGLGLLVVMAPYLTVQHAQTDRWSLVEANGWFEYMRIAPFADCSKFTPPKGTEILCESTPPSQRPGPDYYIWGGGPARATYGDFRVGNDQLRAFSTAAIKAQPVDYADEVLADFSRYFLPVEPRHDVNPGTGPEVLRVHSYASSSAVDNVSPVLASYYGVPSVRTQPFVLDTLGRMQQVMRIGTLALSSALLLSVVGAIRLRRERGWILLFVGMTLATLLACVATSNFSTRYAVPVIPFAFIGAALAGSGLTRGRRRVRDRGADEPPTAATPDRPRQLVPVP
ncbi:MAG TPA: glycosyltransferase family 39 protein, partial [Acidimicrobiales bacterium]|nr:glycosyltransferase family 39 protein [Acidimicrobiales bacterium]